MEHRIMKETKNKEGTEGRVIFWIEGKHVAILLHVSVFIVSICEVCGGHF